MNITKNRNDYIQALEANGYRVDDLLGTGLPGLVFQCTRLDTDTAVAVKAMSEECSELIQNEVDKLENLDQDHNHLVRVYRHFELDGKVFVEYELLDMTVTELMHSLGRPLYLSEIQFITKQILEALTTLKSVGVVHGNINLDNIMLINHQLQPFEVKLIDFALARYISEMAPGDIISLTNKPPEVSLGLPQNEAVDMWALGCAMAIMYLNTNLHSGDSDLEIMKEIVQLHGKPDDNLLNAGLYTNKYFIKDKSSNSSWQLRRNSTWLSLLGSNSTSSVTSNKSNWQTKQFLESLNDIGRTRPGTAELEDTQAFLSVLKQMLQVDPAKRLTPSEALAHPFFTMKNFPSDFIRMDDICSDRAVASSSRQPPSAARTVRSLSVRSRDEIAEAPYSTLSAFVRTQDIIRSPNVKTKKSFLRRICNFFSKMCKTKSCTEDMVASYH